ncbi:unnamed protein product [Parascedosporium putredinis]|uniref:Tyrosine decarboxylase n=1 Tax=Parascedosporium putredinis TaxID=1442378 RepID=A0A9P1H1V6_9PEZI|nr:unnamed protein product [Parascedosporium putredinis]CAI7994134.1 unnamed protein product [Parascedosporium putredinis]
MLRAPIVLKMDHLYDFSSQKARLSRRKEGAQAGEPTLPPRNAIQAAEASLPDPSSAMYLSGMSQEDTVKHIVDDIVPGLNGQALSSRYYGFVTGGTLPIAEWADNVVSRADQNAAVHLPDQTVATAVEDAALKMAILAKKLGSGESVGELGLLEACVRAGVTGVQVLTCAGHSSLSKAASVVGLGRRAVKELGVSAAEPWRLDVEALERELRAPGVVSVISVSAGEVNTGRHAVSGVQEMKRVRELADRYGAWLHVDGAFGIFSRALDGRSEYRTIRERCAGVELADSITVDAHKLLNVPYDCGMFFTRSHKTLEAVFMNPNAAYLAALPAYAVLLSEGRPGIAGLLSNMTELSRQAARFVQQSEHYELLPDENIDEVFMIVLFRAKDKKLNDELVSKINATRKIYVSPTSWNGEKAVRIAVSTWMVDVSRDMEVIASVLTEVAGQ